MSDTIVKILPLRKRKIALQVPSEGFNESLLIDFMDSRGFHSDFTDRCALYAVFAGKWGDYTGSQEQNEYTLTLLKKCLQNYDDKLKIIKRHNDMAAKLKNEIGKLEPLNRSLVDEHDYITKRRELLNKLDLLDEQWKNYNK